MTRIRTTGLRAGLSIWVYANDHAPPHFHVISTDEETSVAVAFRGFAIMAGTYRRKDLADALAWARQAANYALIAAEWSRLHERD